MRFLPFLLALSAASALAACGSQDEGIVDVALIGSEDSAFADGLRLSAGAQHVRAATESGLVALDAEGDIVPALAERWIVTDDGLSFIFRLRDTPWPDGEAMSAPSARTALMEAIAGLRGTSLALDLAPIEEVRAMAGRVIEIRLTSPEPNLLHLLAQPELALRHAGGGTGPMVEEREAAVARFAFKPPLDRGLPMVEDWQDDVREVHLHVGPAEGAIARFDGGEAELVLGGDLGNFSLVETGPLSAGTLRVEPTFGLFGLAVLSESGLLSNDGVREGLAMAIDREALLSRYNIAGWVPTTRPVSPGLPGDPGLVAERWVGMPIAERRSEAAARVTAWRRQFDRGNLLQPARVTIRLAEGPGWDQLLQDLALQLTEIGIRLERASSRQAADLVLVDRIARYPSPRWFLNQFNCSLRRGLCSEEIDAMVAAALEQPDRTIRAAMLAQAEAEFTLANVYIPIGSPLRWSLVRGSVDGFVPNAFAFHPLPELAEIPR